MSSPKFYINWFNCLGHLTLMYFDDGLGGVMGLIAPKALVIQFAKTLFRPVSHLTMINRFGSLHKI